MNILIIGFGHAGRAYLKSIQNISNINKIHIIDINVKLSETIPLNASFSKSCPEEIFDVGIVCTPPISHLDVLKKYIKHTKKIIIEKPIALEDAEINEIFDIAEKNKVFFSIHSMYGKELLFSKKKLYKLEPNSYITQLFYDPYFLHKSNHLGGPFWDSIYNALGIIYFIFGSLEINKIKILKDDSFSFQMNAIFNFKSVNAIYNLTINWDKPANLKITEIFDPQLQNGLLINHNQQCITDLSGENIEHKPFQISRLATHYKNVLVECINDDNFTSNNKLAKRISKQVLKINKARKN